MKYGYTVKLNGVLYPAGTDVPVGEEEKESDVPVGEEEKPKRGRKPKEA